jgi:putative transposase
VVSRLESGNQRGGDVHKPGDFDAFVEVMTDACSRVPVDLLGYCLMPNHFHFVLRPRRDGDLGVVDAVLLTAYARRHHRLNGTTGHVWRTPLKAFPVEDDDHLVKVLRYVERNPLRAELVSSAEDRKRSSLPAWKRGSPLPWCGEVSVREQRWLGGPHRSH